MSETSDTFYPNSLKPEDVANLKGWQLLIAACHFGPTMGDCRSLNYGYYIKDNIIFLDSERGADIALTDDIDMEDPPKGLLKYAVVSPWPKFAARLIREAITKEV